MREGGCGSPVVSCVLLLLWQTFQSMTQTNTFNSYLLMPLFLYALSSFSSNLEDTGVWLEPSNAWNHICDEISNVPSQERIWDAEGESSPKPGNLGLNPILASCERSINIISLMMWAFLLPVKWRNKFNNKYCLRSSWASTCYN